MDGNFTDSNGDINGTHGQLVYVQNDDVVYSFVCLNLMMLTTLKIGSAKWLASLISAKVLASLKMLLEDVVWAKRMDNLVEVPMPDGRIRKQRLVDYVTMDANYATPLGANGSATMPYNFYQPKGLYGFKGLLEFNVNSPQEFNDEAIPENNASAYSFFFLDHNSADSITIIEPGEGMNNIQWDQVQVFGPGFQPEGIGGEQQDWEDAEIETFNNIMITG